MNIILDEDNRRILDGILPYFEFNEVVNIKNCIRKSMSNDYVGLNNMPVSLHADAIRDFLVRYSFAINYSGDAIINSKGMALKNAKSLHAFVASLHKQHDYIVVDDDDFNNRICINIIRSIDPEAKIQTFTDPNIGLRHIQANYGNADTNDIVLLLDINMPTLLGWEVLDEFKNFPDAIKDRFKIFMLTSSINPKDKERALGNPFLWGYIEKPLTSEKVKTVLIQDDPFETRKTR